MVTIRPRQAIGALIVLGGALFAWSRFGSGPDARPASGLRSRVAEADVPRIDLERLSRPQKAPRAGLRDLFEYGAAPAPRLSQAQAPAPLASPPPPTSLAAAVGAAATGTAPLSLRYIGSIESKGTGLKVAFLMTDRREVLAGQAGEVVANRFRIRRIGFESVEIQDLVSDSVHRLPLRGGN